MPPKVSQALSRGAAAVSRSGWLGAVGLLVTILRTALFLPGQLFALVMAQLAAASWLARHGGVPLPGLAAQGVQLAVSSPRFVSILGGLWLAAALLATALRVAYLAGALPTIGAELGSAPRRHRFAEGFARGFAALLPTAAASIVAELAALIVAAGLFVASAIVAARLFGAGRGGLAAFAVAAGATSALLLIASTAALCDAALCRVALRGERTVAAFAAAALRFGSRPAAFLAVGVAATALGVALDASMDALAALGAGAAASAPSPWLAVGPQLLAAALAAFVAAVVELWRFASTAVLACHTR